MIKWDHKLCLLTIDEYNKLPDGVTDEIISQQSPEIQHKFLPWKLKEN